MIRLVLISCALLALASCHKPQQPQQQQAANQTVEVPGVPTKGVDRSHKGTAVSPLRFNDPDGKGTSLAVFAGKPTLVNLWATWCAPCVKELPTLDRLARARGGGLNVVAISQDIGPHASVEAFLKEHSIATLDSYQDPQMGLSGALGADVLPTTILYDARGREVWRYVGDLDWTGPQAARLLAEGGVGQTG